MSRAPLAPAAFPDLPEIRGLRLGTAAAGVRYAGRDDVMVAVLPEGASMAGVYTRSATASGAVLDCRAKTGRAPKGGAAVVVNAGNANAFTGAAGDGSVAAICAAAARVAGVPEARVFTASTGVIGERLDHGRIVSVLGAAAEGGATWEAAATAIGTTDTYPKGASETGDGWSVAGIAKGSGMIQPDMATMLAYVFTDADVAQDALQAMLARQADRSFNRITVDSDTSTSDTLMACATRAGAAPDPTAFEAALGRVLTDLAHQVVRDGEGATKFVAIAVTGAADDADALRVARSVANSPLVKTALAGADPNWGRIVMAVGKAGARADRDRLAIRFGDVLVAEAGWVAPGYREEDGAAQMARGEIEIGIDLGLGDGAATVWTCDLTHGYVAINADYRS